MTARSCFQPGLSAARLAARPAPQNPARAWRPPVDVVESDDAFVLSLDVPGVSEDALDVEMDRGRLTVSGSREATNGGRSHVAERRAGSFERVFKLPSAVADDQIDALLENGVLTIRVPKAETKRTITVQ